MSRSNAIKSKPNPTRNSPKFFTEVFLTKLKKTPTPTIGSATFESENLNPSHAITHAVVVVPKFAPIITPIASLSVKSPALTKPTTITVVTVDD